MKLSSLSVLVALVASGAVGACQGTVPPVPSQDATSQAPPAPPAPVAFASTTIDTALRAQWAKVGVTPSPRVDDAGFLRRAYLDVVGTVPPPSAVTAFLADTAPDKRAKLIDRLLASPAYALYWATLWEDTLVGWNTKDQFVDRRALRDWLEGEFAANTSWDKIITQLLTATGQNSNGGNRLDDAPAPPGGGEPDVPRMDAARPINGAVNWFLKYKDAPQDIAGNASRLFLGVQIQCAQCHDHKTEKWKQDDFRRFAACFARTRSEPIDQGKAMGRKRAMVVDIGRPLPRFAKNPDLAPITVAEPTTLDGLDIGTSADVRGALAAWVTAKKNPWFAKAIVNRMWGHFLGRGFIDPVDDIRDSNYPTMPELFGELSDDFTAHGDDLKALIRTITATEAYQLAPAPVATKAAAPKAVSPLAEGNEERFWARFHVTPLGPNELIRSILDATDVESVLAKNARANLDRIRFQIYQRYTFLFDVDEDFEQTDFEGTVAQALTLLNGELVGGGTAGVPGGALDAILHEPSADAEKVTALYLRTVSRAPTADELAYWTHYVNEPHAVEPFVEDKAAPPPPPAPRTKKNGKPAKGNKPAGPDALTRLETRDARLRPDSRRQAYADLFWALLNSSEFTFNH
jgi:Protein of unknown function (DUF1549)/Protein of unknown function (DUF1553)